MTIKPILFSGPMVRALLDGRKTQDRRVLKNQEVWNRAGNEILRRFPRQKSGIPYAPGDLLWVRESHKQYPTTDPWGKPGRPEISYADDDDYDICDGLGWKSTPSNHMPRWASRLTLEVTDVRVQRVQDISEEDALSEGVGFRDGYPQQDFAELWDSLNAKRGFGWEVNPWVVALTFTVHRCNVDRLTPTRRALA